MRTVTQRHTQRLVRWLLNENWIHKQQNHVPFADAQLFKLRDERLGFSRLTLAVWPLRSALASWRRSHPDAPWEDAMGDVLSVKEGRTLSASCRKLFETSTSGWPSYPAGTKDARYPKLLRN